MARRLDMRAPDFAAQFEALLGAKRDIEDDVAASVRSILADVRKRGDDALIELAQRFDRATLTVGTLRVSEDEIAEAKDAAASKRWRPSAWRRNASKFIIAANCRRTNSSRTRPVPSSAGAGRPSTAWASMCRGARRIIPAPVLMNAVPARVAGVARIAMVTPASGGSHQSADSRRCKTGRRERDLSRRWGAGDRRAHLWHRDTYAPLWTRSWVLAMPLSQLPSAKCLAHVGIDSDGGARRRFLSFRGCSQQTQTG
jgi:hypothetical protein